MRIFRPAERVGFEPTVATRATAVFETAPFVHSGTSPVSSQAIIPELRSTVLAAHDLASGSLDLHAIVQIRIVDTLQAGHCQFLAQGFGRGWLAMYQVDGFHPLFDRQGIFHQKGLAGVG